MFKDNFNLIERKNYDNIIAKSIKNNEVGKKKKIHFQIKSVEKDKNDNSQPSIFEQTSFNFNNLSGW